MTAALELEGSAIGGAADEGAIEICSVRVGAMVFGVPIMRILEILGATATQSVPLAPAFIGGLVHYHGEVLTTISLRRLLEMPWYEDPQDVLVFEGQDGYFGVLVDAVGAVLSVPAEAMESNPSTLHDRRRALFAGACKLEDGLLIMLDPDRLDPMRLAK